jgi:hypothetical protein
MARLDLHSGAILSSALSCNAINYGNPAFLQRVDIPRNLTSVNAVLPSSSEVKAELWGQVRAFLEPALDGCALGGSEGMEVRR